MHGGALLGYSQPLPSAGALCATPKSRGVPWCFPSSPPKCQPVPTTTSLWTGFREESCGPTGPADPGLDLGSRALICWLGSRTLNLLALLKIIRTKYLGQTKGRSIAGILQSHGRSRAGAGLGRGCRCRAGAAGAQGSQAGVRSEGIRHFRRWVQLHQGAAAGEDRNVTAECPGIHRADQDLAGQATGKTSQVVNRRQLTLGNFQGHLPRQPVHSIAHVSAAQAGPRAKLTGADPTVAAGSMNSSATNLPCPPSSALLLFCNV